MMSSALINEGYGVAEWEKQRDGREAMQIFAAEIGKPVISHAPWQPPGHAVIYQTPNRVGAPDRGGEK